jgi:uncharacterized membrane protein
MKLSVIGPFWIAVVFVITEVVEEIAPVSMMEPSTLCPTVELVFTANVPIISIFVPGG